MHQYGNDRKVFAEVYTIGDNQRVWWVHISPFHSGERLGPFETARWAKRVAEEALRDEMSKRKWHLLCLGEYEYLEGDKVLGSAFYYEDAPQQWYALVGKKRAGPFTKLAVAKDVVETMVRGRMG